LIIHGALVKKYDTTRMLRCFETTPLPSKNTRSAEKSGRRKKNLSFIYMWGDTLDQEEGERYYLFRIISK